MGPTTRLLGCRSPIMKSNSLAGHVSGPVRTSTRLDFAQLATRRCTIKIKPVAALGEVPRRIRKTRVRIPPPPRVLKVHLLWRREHCWRCTMHPTPSERVLVVSLKDRTSPFDRVAYSDTRRLWPRPQFEVLRTIVVTHSIAMMHRFGRFVEARRLCLAFHQRWPAKSSTIPRARDAPCTRPRWPDRTIPHA